MVSLSIVIGLYALCVFLIYSFSAAENAVFSLSADDIRVLEKENGTNEKWLSERLKKPREFIQYFTILRTFLFAGLLVITAIFNVRVPGWPTLLVSGVLAWGVFLLYANAFPGRDTREDKMKKALRWLSLVRLFGAVMFPFLFLWKVFLRLLVPEGGIGGPLAIERELDKLMPDGRDFASLESEEKEMIRHVVDFRNTTVREVMVPRIDMVCIPTDATPTDAVKVINEAGHTRVPLYKDRIDNVVGVLYAKDLLNAMSSDSEFKNLMKIARKPYFVPESKLTSKLFNEMRRAQIHMAIVVDEYGGTAGLVTLEDLIEEIVGEIQDEYDFEEIPIRKLSENVYNVEAKLAIDEVNEELGISLPEEDSETLGGFIYGLAGAIPSAGDRYEFENLLFIVESVSGQRLEKVKIIIKDKDEEK